MKTVGLALILALGAGAVHADTAAASSDGLIQSVSVADARTLLTNADLKVETVEYHDDGFTMYAAITPERHVWFEGMNCKGAAGSMACTEFMIGANWELDTAEQASALAKRLDFNYAPVSAAGKVLTLSRMDFVYGGVTREHIRQMLIEILDLRRQTEDAIWPPKNSADPGA